MIFKNMKIKVENNLEDIVGELERIGYKKLGWSCYRSPAMIITYGDSGWFTDCNKSINRGGLILTTLAELKEM